MLLLQQNLLNDNVCVIKIPEIQEDIETIKILYRYGNKATFRELAEVPNQQDNNFNDDNWSQDSREYKFYNDQVSTGVSPSDVAKTFDNLPRQAKAQSAISNRLGSPTLRMDLTHTSQRLLLRSCLRKGHRKE